MATLEQEPIHRFRNQSYTRAQDIKEILECLRNGETASGIQSLLIEKTGRNVSLDPVKTTLWHLHDIGLAEFEICDNSRWWKLKKRVER